MSPPFAPLRFVDPCKRVRLDTSLDNPYGTQTMDYEERRVMFETIKSLVKPEQEEIFRIIHRLKVPYSENSNGIFFDLTALSQEAYSNLKEYIHFCLQTRQDHETRLKDMEAIRTQLPKEDEPQGV